MPAAHPLPVVLIGSGAVSRQLYAPALAQLEKSGLVRVVALIDPAEPARDPLAPRFAKAKKFARLEDVTTLERGALAIIASSASEHCAQALFAARSGWHILCETPFATTSTEAAKMLRAVETAGVRLAVGHHRRLLSAARALKHLCTGQSPLGQLMRFTINEGRAPDWPPGSSAMLEQETVPSGVLLELGSDALDLLVWWLGQPLDYVYADDAMGGREINARLTLRFGTATGQIQLSRDWTTANRYTFEFARGRAAWTVNEANHLTLELHGLPFALQSALLETDGRPADDHRQSFRRHLEQVIVSTRDGSPLPVDGAAGAQILQLIENCYARRRLLPQPWLTSDERRSAQNLAEAGQ